MSKGPPRQNRKKRTKKGAANTRRLPPEIPARSACQRAAGNVPAKNAHQTPVVRRIARPGQNGGTKKSGLHRGGSESLAIPNTITK
jgi:hypothetical protein